MTAHTITRARVRAWLAVGCMTAVVVWPSLLVAAQDEVEEEPTPTGQIQEGPWADSAFAAEPAEKNLRTSTEATPYRSSTATLAVKGTLVLDRVPGGTIAGATADIAALLAPANDKPPMRNGNGDLHPRCTVPEPTVKLVTPEEPTDAAEHSSRIFTVGTGDPAVDADPEGEAETENPFQPGLRVACNGTYEITVTGTASGGQTATLTGYALIAVPPVAVTDVVANGSDESNDVGVTFRPPADTAPDTRYRVQRRLAFVDEWSFASGTCAEPVRFLDAEAGALRCTDVVDRSGDYVYRVVASRPYTDPVTTPDGSLGETGAGIPAPSSSVPTTRSTGGTIHSGQLGQSSATTVTVAPRTTATTIDTGFEEELPYEFDPVEPGELAGEGQSVILDEDGDGMGLLPAAAGASILLVAAGQVRYLRRLAAQF